MQLLKPTKFPHVPPYAYTRQGFDRKSPLFQLVLRSGLFYVFLDDRGNVTGFSSPRTIVRIGAMPFFT